MFSLQVSQRLDQSVQAVVPTAASAPKGPIGEGRRPVSKFLRFPMSVNTMFLPIGQAVTNFRFETAEIVKIRDSSKKRDRFLLS
jgi:hypothetical protein